MITKDSTFHNSHSTSITGSPIADWIQNIDRFTGSKTGLEENQLKDRPSRTQEWLIYSLNSGTLQSIGGGGGVCVLFCT